MLFLLFQIGDDRYALDAARVAEVLPLVALKEVPGAPAGVAGLLLYRGTPVPVVDVGATLLGRPAQALRSTRLVLVRRGGADGREGLLGLVVERATGTARIEPEAFVPGGLAADGAPALGPVAPAPDGRGLVQRVEPDLLLSPEILDALDREAGRAMSRTTFPDCEALLREHMGLDPESVSPAAVERAVAGRLRARGLDAAAYLHLLRSSEEELQELVEAVIVPETWFFRDREAFALLARVAREEWAGRGEAARLLSLPCSTGEEPYTLAMVLLDAGLAPDRFRIDAVDISRRSLETAREGRYGRNSFRGDDLSFRERHFVPESRGRSWTLGETARHTVRFREGNLFDPALLLGEAPYDAVFCRNVLIYFDLPFQNRTVAVLKRLLAPRGLLFVGPSETSLMSERGFAAVRSPQTFAFRRTEAGAKKAAATAPTAPRTLPRPTAAAKPPRPSVPPPFQHAPAPAPTAPDPLAEVRALADQGRLAEAAALGEAELHAHGPAAATYYLLGVVNDALRSPAAAAEFYRKALYLDPVHREALAHLASLLASRGDKDGARILAERLRRLPPATEETA